MAKGKPKAKAKPAPVADRQELLGEEAPPQPVCLYTGAPMELTFDEDLRHPGWYFKGGFDPTLPFMDMVSATRAILTRDGRANGTRKLECPYTGCRMRTIQKDGMWWIDGDDVFNPRRRWQNKEDAMYAVMHRGGVPPENLKPHPRISVREIEEPGLSPAAGLGDDPDGVVRETVERIAYEEGLK